MQWLRGPGRIKPGIKALIYGAGGGLGTFAVQLAKYYGAEVPAFCGKMNIHVLRSLGAGYAISYLDGGINGIIGHYDFVLAVNGSKPLKACLRLLATGGICVMVGGSLEQVVKALVFGGFMSLGSRKIHSFNAKPDAVDLAFVIRLAEEGRLRSVLDRRYPLAWTIEAVRYQNKGHAMGKIIIEVV